jgi:hypothetical protein
MADETGEEEKDNIGVILKIVGILVVVLFLLARFMPKSTSESVEYGIKVVSEIPFERLQSMKYIALYNTTNSAAELTCKFELSAISEPALNGYRIKIEDGETGIYLRERDATISGRNSREILIACHVFACLREGLECPNFMLVDNFFRKSESMSVILDEDVGAAGGRGYAEVVGALSFLQSRRSDTDEDGLVEQEEVDANNFFIYPFIKRGDLCYSQSFNNLIQNWSATNETHDCANIAPAIMLKISDEPGIFVKNSQVIITGDDDQIRAGAIIIRDVLAPEWVRRLYGYL